VNLSLDRSLRLQYSVWVNPDAAQRSMFDFQYLLSFSFVSFLDLGMGSPPLSLEALYGPAMRGGRWGLNIAYFEKRLLELLEPSARLWSNRKTPKGRPPNKPIDRWKVERTFVWLQKKYRRLVVRWERKNRYWLGFVLLALCIIWIEKIL